MSETYTTEAQPKAWADGVPVFCAHDAVVDVAKLVPNPRNPNKHPDNQIQLLGRIIRQTGWRAPITVSTRSGFIVKGHGRLSAALLEGVKEVPVDYQGYASEAEEYADLVADNRIAELAEIDNKMLADIFAEIDTGEIPMELTGYTEDEVEDIVTALSEALHNDLTEPDEIPDTPEGDQIITQKGDLWILGRHRVMCGDSTDWATVEKVMDGEKADLVFTDPPYGMKKEAEGVHNDNLNFDDLLNFNKKWIPLTFKALKENGSWYCWGLDEPLMDIYCEILRPMIKAEQIVFRNFIKWKKADGVQNMLAPTGRSYSPMGESCLFLMCGAQAMAGFTVNQDDYNPAMDKVRLYLASEAERLGITPAKIKEICGCGMYSHWFSKSQFSIPTKQNYKKLQKYYSKQDGFKKEYDEIKKEYDEIKKEYDEIKKEFYNSRAYFDNTHEKMGDVWEFSPTGQKERELTGGHATPKPIALCSRAIKSSSRENELVLDVFGGSGSTLIACEQEQRECRMVELDPRWCDVIVRRYINTTGNKTGIRLFRKGQELGREHFERMFTD